MSIPIAIVLVYLCFCIYTDIKNKTIPYYPSLIIFGIILLLCLLHKYANNNLSFNFIFSLIPGLILLSLSYLTNESIGYGDSILLSTCCITTSPFNSLIIICFSLFYSAIYSIILLIKGNCRKDTIAFVPFIFLGYLTFLLLKL